MNIAIPYSIKRKLCVKRTHKRKIELYKEKVNQIMAFGKADHKGIQFKSVADLTSAFYKN
ncbi:hypothetical protein BN1088_140016 [Sphingobacterium sp. PM2-P1-29]|nr:hypothetical protein BN1088_140016 [Sphingobacterium sp. PM2-P1-29]